MSHKISRQVARRSSAALAAAILALVAAPDTPLAQAQSRRVPDTFTATTTDMTPAGVTLRIDVVEWSDGADRAAAVSALVGAADDAGSLAQLPTIGFVWSSGSAAGHAIKYAHRVQESDGRERLTFVTDKRLDAYSFKPWTAGGAGTEDSLDYSVIELYLDGEGKGTGTLSLAAEVILDDGQHVVSLAEGDVSARLLTDAMAEPKPYWAQGG